MVPGIRMRSATTCLAVSSDEQFRNWRLIVRPEVRQDVGNVNAPAIARKQHLLRISMRDEALDFRAGGEVDQRDAVGNAVGNVKGFAGAVGDQAHRSPAGFERALHRKRGGIDFGDRVAPFVGNVKRLAVGRNRQSLGFVADCGFRDNLLGLRVNGQHGVIAFADDVQLFPVGGELYFDGGQICGLGGLGGLRIDRRGHYEEQVKRQSAKGKRQK